MMILIGTLFVALAVFANYSELGSPERLPNQVYKPISSASTSGRKFEELSSANRNTKEPNTLYPQVGYYNEKGIFYEENGNYYPVQRGTPLLEHRGFIIGRPSNGFVAPIFNSDRKPVLADEDSYNIQYTLTKVEAQKHYLFERIPPHYRVVNLPDDPEPELEVLPYYGEARVKSSALAKKSRKEGKKKKRVSK